MAVLVWCRRCDRPVDRTAHLDGFTRLVMCHGEETRVTLAALQFAAIDSGRVQVFDPPPDTRPPNGVELFALLG